MNDEAAISVSNGGHGRPPLDDVMLAMDVVDTLRRRERIVRKEMDETGRAEDLKERLRRIYAQQGIEVPDHVIEQGVAALKEERFTYKPPPPGLNTKLARLYVSRGRWGKWIGGGAAVLGVGLLANHLLFVAPDAALPEDLAARHAEVLELAETAHARATADRFMNAGTAALRNEDAASAKEAIKDLDRVRRLLEQEYSIRIINRADESTGVWRIPDVNTGARNHYVVVEALDPSGEPLAVPIENEETGKTELVQMWGLRVDKATFESVAADKRDNGIIERDRFGYKARGRLLPEYEMPTTGGAITSW